MRTAIISLFIILISYNTMAQKDYNKEWKTIDSLQNLGQTQSALDVVMTIYHKSKTESLSDQTIKALLYKIKLESEFQEESFEKAIAFTQVELENSQQPVKQLLYSILAQLYWDYYSNNSWQIDGRTTMIGEKSADITTWDSKKFVEECTEFYSLSLTDAGILKNTSLSSFESILESKKNTRKLRPTLFDFLAFRAVEFFASERAGVTIAANSFKINIPDYFAPAAEFIQLQLRAEGTKSFEFYALSLYQEILSFHINDLKDFSALIDADLARLEFVFQKSTLPNKDNLYKKALKDLGEKYKNHPFSATVWYELAVQLNESGSKYKPLVSDDYKWDKKEALNIAENATKSFPESDGANNCRNLIEQIKTPFLQITSNYAVRPLKPSLVLVDYKNIEKLYFRIIRLDPEKDQKLSMQSQEEILTQYISASSLQMWNISMPSDGDFQSHSTEVKNPALPTGYYVLLVSTDDKFSSKSHLAYSRFWSTNLSVINKHNSNGDNELLVVDRTSGQPMAKVKVQTFTRQYDYRSREYVEHAGKVYFTDKNGFVLLNPGSPEQNTQFYLVISTKNDKFITDAYFSNYRYDNNEIRTETRTHFFTDRSIYRPGQTIYYKGIVVEKKGNQSKIKTTHRSKVDFYDVNGQVISSQDVISNEFGSFSGTFMAPAGVLTGSMSISNGSGSTTIQVEEYKRPKFEITFNPIKGSYKLDKPVSITGKALAYAGSSISGATVTYRVVRNVRFPYFWWGWRGIYPSSPELEIANGVLTTDTKGEFEITFNAISDPTVTARFSPIFTYSVFADVSDINGETHSAETSVSVGYDALLVTTNINDELNSEKGLTLEIKTTNLNGEPEPASGIVSINKIVAPAEILFSRKWERPDKFTMSKGEFLSHFPGEIYSDEDDVTKWTKGESVFSKTFSTPADSAIKALTNPEPGTYVIEIKTKDAFGKEIIYTKYFTVFAPMAKTPSTTSPVFFNLLTPNCEPGQVASLLLATPLKNVYAIVETVSLNTKLSRKYYKLSNQQLRIDIPITEEHRGNMAIHVIFVKNNRVFQQSKVIEIPFTNKELDIAISSFRSKLEPGAQEEWQITIKDKQGEKAVAEMLAGMYDASLDAFTPHNWYFNLLTYLNFNPNWSFDVSFRTIGSTTNWYPQNYTEIIPREYEKMLWFGYNRYSHYRGRMGGDVMYSKNMVMEESMVMDKTSAKVPAAAPVVSMIDDENTLQMGGVGSAAVPPAQPMSPKPRKDFNETAFFFPQLTTNVNGETSIKFTMPESLTRWRMMGIAHTKDLKVGHIEKSLLTQKDLMVFPNAPRFLREGDKLQFSTKIANISDGSLSGKAELHFFDAITMQAVDANMKNMVSTKSFSVQKGENTVVSWDICIPEGLQAVVYKVTATAGTFSDGEEAALPVFTNRMLVTESLPLPVKGNASKSFSFDKLTASKKAGSTLRNYKLTLEFTSNPAWYAVQALPYLMEYPYECAEQLFSRYYANTLATHIANSDPKIKRVFESWKNSSPNALKSNLQKNEELKAILLQESPWVQEANNESERKQRIALLFDLNRMALEQTSALKKLQDMQSSNGGWPWFPGMPESEYITQHIVTGLGHLYYLESINKDSNADMFEMLRKAIEYLDTEKLKSFEKMKKEQPDYNKSNHLGYNEIQYLYARTYFMADFPFNENLNEMLTFYNAQATQYWKTNANYAKAMTALFMNRFGEEKTASLIMRSLSETALHNDEMGMYWRNNTAGWNWYEAPIETQAMMIEAFDEVLGDNKSVEELKVWLLKQKQTQDWKTTKATTEAVYALLLRGESLLASDKQVSIKVGNEQVNPYLTDGIKPEPGTGYFKTSWNASQITPEMGAISVSNPNPTVAWGAMYWQYYEQLDKITPAATPLKLNKQLFVEVNSPSGPVLEPITDEKPIQVGDKIVVRVILSTDRAMEYIHLKDMRASAFEPINVLSGYRWQDGLGYYEATGDAATNFFIYYLPKGTYVFEYKLNATQKGEFSNGITSVQCMYAPEFSAHSEGIRVTVK